MKVFCVWCPARGQEIEDGRLVKASCHELAATLWAEIDDARSADYLIVGGNSVEVLVAAVEDQADKYERFLVSGRSEPVYSARAVP